MGQFRFLQLSAKGSESRICRQMSIIRQRNNNCVKRHCCVNCCDSDPFYMSQAAALRLRFILQVEKRLFRLILTTIVPIKRGFTVLIFKTIESQIATLDINRY